MTELVDCINDVTFEGESSNDYYQVRVAFKKDPTFDRNLLTGATVINEPSELEGKVGTLFISTKDPDTYKSCASWFNSFANKDVGNLIKRYENIMSKIDSHHKGYEILFRPAGTILEPTEWVFYRLTERKFNNPIPKGEWTINYVLCCGGDEKFIQGAPTSFAVFSRV
jgi:hypothetical protein